ncbi:MAG: DUF4381 domain-containing protein [Francisella sp.]
MQTNDLLKQLKDIYLPERIFQWWPLAYGWWILFAVIFLIFIVILIFLYLKIKSKRYKDLVVKDFRQTIESTYQQIPTEVLQVISVYLKRVALHKFPNSSVKTLYGQQWLDFLDTKLKKPKFNNTKANMLKDCYKPVNIDKETLIEIMTVAEQWLRRVL